MRTTLIPRLTSLGGGPALQIATVGEQRGEELIEGAVYDARRGLLPIHDGILDCLPDKLGPLSAAQSVNLLPVTAWGYERPWRVRSLSLFSGEPLGFAREQQILFEMLGPLSGTLWLDVASSSGLYARWLAPRLPDSDIVALDFSWPMLRAAQSAAHRGGHHRVGFVRARGEALPFGTASLDGVLCGGSLNEFGAQAPRVLREVARAMRPSAPALFMYLRRAATPTGRRAQRLAELGGINFWDEAEAHALFGEAGLTLDDERVYGLVAFARLHPTSG